MGTDQRLARRGVLAGLAAAMLAPHAAYAGPRLGTVGMIKPTHRAGTLEEIIPFLPPGVGMIPVYLDIRRGTEEEFAVAIPAYEKEIALLADQRCDLIHAEGAPPFMVQGYRREGEIVDAWEKRYKTPIFTSSQNQVNALRALGAKRFVGATYFPADQNAVYAKYFTDAGFTVLSMDGIDVPFDKVQDVPSSQIYAYIKANFAKQNGVDAIYMLGSAWQTLDIIARLESELGVPVVHPVLSRAWEIQKRLHLHMPVPGYGRLLAELP
jgi:maleate isomerase